MASRSSRKSVTTTTYQSTSGETPTRQGTSPGRRARSPSPARATRMQEKEQLQNLNDRLAAYIDRVRYLENENSRLQIQVRSSEETVTREVGNIKELYENELKEARKLLDETTTDKVKLQIDKEKFKTDAVDWQNKYHKRDRDAKNVEKKLLELQSECGALRAQFDDAEAAKKMAEAEAARLRAENRDLMRQLEDLKKQLQDETLKRADLENRLQSMKEELDFNTRVHEKELNETRTRSTLIYDEYDAGAQAEYETKLQDALQTLRAEQDEQLRSVRIEVEEIYERKLADLQGALDRSMNLGSTSRDEYLVVKHKCDELNSEVTKLRTQNAELESRVRDLESELSHERRLFNDHLAEKDSEIAMLREDLNEQTREYADLLDIKLRLDNEIEAYRKLLEGEEERLNLSQSSSSTQSTPKKGGRGMKRKRVTLDTSSGDFREEFKVSSAAQGNLVITEIDKEGKFIKISNTGTDEYVLGGWTLTQTADDNETTYKFHRNLHIKAGAECTIWSSDANQTHSPPSDLVMKNQKWFTADNIKAVLYEDDEERASMSMSKEERSSLILHSRSRDSDSGREQCAIM